jgi:hypothetical protein
MTKGEYPDYIKKLSNEELNKRVESYQRSEQEEVELEVKVWWERFLAWLRRRYGE